MDFIKIFFTALGGTSAAIAIAAFLGKKWISHQLDKKLIAYQKELEAKAEVLKSNLSIFAHEQSVGISRIDAQRADAIKSIYSKIVHWKQIVGEINYPKSDHFNSDKEMFSFFENVRMRLSDANEDLVTEVAYNAIYFSSSTYDNLFKNIDTLTKYTIEISKIIDEFIRNGDINHLELTLIDLSNEKAQFEQYFEPLKMQLVDEFRCILKAQ